MSTIRNALSVVAGASLAALSPTLALAHHPTGGMTPQTSWHGFLSGVGHPVLGLDHLAFIVGIGLLMALSRRWLMLPAAFVATLVPGVLVHSAGVGIGPAEVIVAMSVALLGAAVLAEQHLPRLALAGAVMLAGFFHGYAFGETIVGAETAPILAYLVGLSVTIAAMTGAIGWIGRRMQASGVSGRLVQRVAAVALIAGGALLTMQGLVG